MFTNWDWLLSFDCMVALFLRILRILELEVADGI